MSLETVTCEALKLNRSERIELAHLILDSIAQEENVEDSSEILKNQFSEIKRRVELYKKGRMRTFSAKEVHHKLVQKYFKFL